MPKSRFVRNNGITIFKEKQDRTDSNDFRIRKYTRNTTIQI